jgi:hypothetical protein
MIPTIAMAEEDIMDDVFQQTTRSESAFSGTSYESGRPSTETKFPVTVECTSYLVPGSSNVRFDLWKPSLEKRTGVRFESGRLYVVRGRIARVGIFESRHAGSPNPHVYVCMDRSTANLVPGRKYGLVVEAIEEKRRFEVLPSARGPVIRPTRAVLEGLGVKTDERSVVELTVKRVEEETKRKVYGRWEPDWGFMQLYLTSAGFAEGEVVEVVGGRSYTPEGFVGDFRKHKLAELANVELDAQGASLTVRVDGRQIPVERFCLTTHGLRAALKLELGYNHKVMKFTFDGRTVEGRLDNSDQILEYSASGQYLDLRYVRTKDQVYVMRLGQSSKLGMAQSLEWLADGICVVSRPSVLEGLYTLEVAESVREEARRRINSTRDDQQYRKVRGDIFEEMVQSLLGEMRMELLYDHPWSMKNARCGSMREGPDLMVKVRGTGEAFYMESKWWEDVVNAFAEGAKQARDYALRRPVWRGLRITGAYIAVMDWRTTESARMWIERVA